MDKDKTAKSRGYTYKVAYQEKTKMGPWAPSYFYTTNDAVEKHRQTCKQRERLGKIKEVEITKL